MIQFAVLMVPFGMTRLWRINPVSQEAHQKIDFRTSASRKTDLLGCHFPPDKLFIILKQDAI